MGELGRGGMGIVFSGHDLLLNRRVAIKVLSPAWVNDASMVERFEREAKTIASLRHPSIVRVHDVGRAAGLPFFVMDFLDGVSVEQLLRTQATLPIGVIEVVLHQIGSALAYAHQSARGVVHRDVKPSNIVLEDDGTATLMDFGISTISEENEENQSITRTGVIMGTAEYMSPEHVQGSVTTHLSDQYSLGLVIYAMVTGAPPFTGSPHQVLLGHLGGGIPPLREVRPDCPANLSEVVSRMLATDPGDRWPDLQLALTELDLSPPTPGDPSLEAIGELVRAARSWEETAGPRDEEPVENRTAKSPRFERNDPKQGGAAAIDDQFFEGGTVVTPNEAFQAKRTPDLPRQLTHYTLHTLRAEGRTGKLYNAYDPVRNEIVGVKVLHDRDGLAQRRLLRGAQYWVGFDHPHVLRILEVRLGTNQVPPFIVTRLVPGFDLGRLRKERELTLEQKLCVVVQLCEGVQYLHDQGVLHREITPRNIVVSFPDIHVTLLDAGVARPVGEADQLTRVGTPVGDPAYMAPEQLRGVSSQRSDVFSIGVVLGQLLLSDSCDAEETEGIVERLHGARLPRLLIDTVGRAVDPNPSERLSSAKELGDRLREFLPHSPREAPLRSVVATLHGIRTHGGWQRTFAEVAVRSGLECRLDKWNYGWFSLLRFLLPWARRGRVRWFRATYRSDFGDAKMSDLSRDRPSIIAHSFGTYILGNALLAYPYLRFNKVILCGSILPEDFPWDAIIARGQVQAVRNEYGSRDFPTRIVQYIVADTGPSGIDGFTTRHARLRQERFAFSHSEYFEPSHMLNRWIPFLKAERAVLVPRDCEVRSPAPRRPWVLYVAYFAVASALVWVIAQSVGA